jgi:hypothetical protein
MTYMMSCRELERAMYSASVDESAIDVRNFEIQIIMGQPANQIIYPVHERRVVASSRSVWG